MKFPGAQCNTLTVSNELRKSLETLGRTERFSSSQVLFREDTGNSGVFLVLSGRICLSVKGLPKLNRFFSTGAVLGLPSTFTGHVYSLTAIAIVDCDTVHVSQDEFLRLMKERPELCREATEILGREVTFIQSALAERRKQMVSRRLSYREVPLVMS
jgi:CRP-like cAMP-binding protein